MLQGDSPMLPPDNRRRAFTAVEMLIVLFIISLLAAFIVVAVQGVRRRAQVQGTRAIIAQLETACRSYFRAWDAYPPDTFADLGEPEPARHQVLRDAGDTDVVTAVEGSECLLLALGSARLGGPYFDIQTGEKSAQVCDLDQDGLKDARSTYWEFADAWKHPIRYENLGDTVGVRLVSSGRDAVFGTPDDLSNR